MNISRRSFLTGAALTVGMIGVAHPQPPPRRNVLLIIADDQGLDLGCYGNSAIKTPNLDQLAASGVRFTHGFTTVSSCSPSRSVMQTGLYNHTNGQYGLAHAPHNQHTLEWVETLPKLLKAAGYATGMVGKMHVKPESLYPFDYHIEFDYIEGSETADNRDVAAIAQKAGEFLSANGARPFFLTIGYGDPHRSQQGFANTRAYSGVKRMTYDPATVRVPYYLPDWPEVRTDLTDYYESVSRLDSGVGLLMQELKSAGREHDTLVIYVSDNGIPFPGAKTTLYDAGIWLPLIVVSPDLQRRGTTNDALVSWVDLAPTILDWAGAKGPASYQLPGHSLLPILGEEHPRGWDEVYASHTLHAINMYYPMRAVRTRGYKYILNLAPQLPYPQASDILGSPSWKAIAARKPEKMGQRAIKAYFERPAEELYDLEKDPNELRNVAADSAYSASLKEMQGKMLAFREKTKDLWLREEQGSRGYQVH